MAKKEATKKGATKQSTAGNEEVADDARSDSTVATVTDKKAAVVRASDRISYDQWKEARKAEKSGRLPLAEALQRLELQSVVRVTAEVAEAGALKCAEIGDVANEEPSESV